MRVTNMSVLISIDINIIIITYHHVYLHTARTVFSANLIYRSFYKHHACVYEAQIYCRNNPFKNLRLKIGYQSNQIKVIFFVPGFQIGKNTLHCDCSFCINMDAVLYRNLGIQLS